MLSQLKAVASNHYLSADIPAEEYIPILLKDSLFSYCGLSDGSAINLTYREVSKTLPAIMATINGAEQYKISKADYQEAYGSETAYSEAFCPDYPASDYIPRILAGAFDDAEDGTCIFVNYNESTSNPDIDNVTVSPIPLPTTAASAPYVKKEGKWQTVSGNLVTIQPDEYSSVFGQSHANLSGSAPATMLPVYLKSKFPFAQADDVKYVAYLYYGGGSTSVACAEYTYNGSEWTDSFTANGLTTVTNQFVRRDGNWQLDPSIEFTLPAGRNQPASMEFFQACVDWVLKNVPNGDKYVTKYGNNDYYTGASAYQGNIDLRASAAKTQYGAEYDSMTDEEVVALEKKRFEEQVCPAVLAQFYPNIAPVGGLEPTVTIHFYTYNGSTTDPQTIIYKVTAKAKFEFVSCTWNNTPGEEE